MLSPSTSISCILIYCNSGLWESDWFATFFILVPLFGLDFTIPLSAINIYAVLPFFLNDAFLPFLVSIVRDVYFYWSASKHGLMCMISKLFTSYLNRVAFNQLSDVLLDVNFIVSTSI